MRFPRPRRLSDMACVMAAGLGLIAVISACGATSGQPAKDTIAVVAAENQYGDVAAQIGGNVVSVTSVESNPNTDPHSYEVSPSIAQQVGAALVVIQRS